MNHLLDKQYEAWVFSCVPIAEQSANNEATDRMIFNKGWDSCENEYKPKLDLALTALKLAHKEMKMTVWREEEVFDLLTKTVETIESKK